MVVYEVTIMRVYWIILWLHRKAAGCDEDGIADVPVTYSRILLILDRKVLPDR